MSQKGRAGKDLMQIGRDYIQYIKVNVLSGNWVAAIIALIPFFLMLYGIKAVGDNASEALTITLTKPSTVQPSVAPTTPGRSSSPNQNTVQENQEKLLGAWDSAGRCSVADGAIAYKGTTEYFRNGSSNFSGEFTLSPKLDGRNAEVTFVVISSGEWKLDGNKLVEKITDMKSQPKFLTLNGEKHDLQLDQSRARELPRLEDFIPQGISSEVTILELSNSRMRLKTAEGSCQGISELTKKSG
jgi:hypothetical protein